ncbi:MAG: RDD family protein [Actinobacteria bacterium]|nr:RDD family protein [Actinomycetota bacterium]
MDDHKFGLSPEDDLPIEAAPTPPPPAEAAASAESPTPTVPLAAAPPAAPVAAAAPMEPTPTPPAPPIWQGSPQAPMAPAPVDISGVGTLATYGQRLGGLLLDVLIMTVLFFIIFIVAMVIGGLFTSGPTSNILSGVATGFFVVLLLGVRGGYPIIFLVKRGQTPGMKIVKIHCVTLDGHAITWGRSIGRTASQLLLSLIPFGLGNIIDLLSPLWDVKRQTLHDKMAGTLVVQDLPH